jgi:hypothetical protein
MNFQDDDCYVINYMNKIIDHIRPLLYDSNRIHAIRFGNITTRSDTHELTYIKLNISQDIDYCIDPFFVWIRISDIFINKFDLYNIGIELCKIAASHDDINMLKKLRDIGWNWNCLTLSEGKPKCIKWAIENECPFPIKHMHCVEYRVMGLLEFLLRNGNVKLLDFYLNRIKIMTNDDIIQEITYATNSIYKRPYLINWLDEKLDIDLIMTEQTDSDETEVVYNQFNLN